MHVERERIDYVVRLSPLWQVRQFMLFRDLEQPDLWLGTDGHGRWGELNGAHRPELDGALDITIAGSPFVHSIPIRRLPLVVGDEAELIVLAIDAETLGRRARVSARTSGSPIDVGASTTATTTIEFDVDDYGVPDRHRRPAPARRVIRRATHAVVSVRAVAHGRAHARVAERERDRRLEEAERVAGVVAGDPRQHAVERRPCRPAPAARR